MNTPLVLDGVAIASEIKAEVAVEVEALARQGIQPGLAVILVGNVAASEIYVRSKVKTCGELGIHSEMLTPPESVTTDELLEMVAALNARDEIDGILIQLPLPAHVDTKKLLEAVDPDKDVDGFHPVNVGRLQSGQPGLQPCTPAGVMEMLRRRNIEVAGKKAVVIGRSDIVGKPMAMLLLNASATVTICHSKTGDLAEVTRGADILVAAIGRPGFVTDEMVKPGAVIVDVGINRVTAPDEVREYFGDDPTRAATFEKRGSVVVGDVHPQAFRVSSAYTPVPGGVGALTIAMLMANTVKSRAAAERRVALGLRVGLTGGLGSGKSTVARMLAAHGAQILSADEIGRALMEPGTATYAAIVAGFGAGVVGPDKRLDRAELARIAFGEGRVEELNAIVHPATIQRQGELAEAIFQQTPDAIVVVESALIFETKFGEGWRERFNKLILVTAPETLKIARFVARSGDVDRSLLEAEAKRRLARMIPDEEKMAQCDFVIRNAGSLDELQGEVERVWSALRAARAGG